MIRSIYLKLPKFLRVLISKLYYRLYFIGLLRGCLNFIKAHLFHHKNRNDIKELKKLIALAKKNKQPIFIQFPSIPWFGTLFQRPQQFAKAMSDIGYLTIYLIPVGYEVCPFKKISDNLYLSDQHEILHDIEGAIISIYFSYPPDYLDHYLTDRFFTENISFYEYVDHVDEEICGKYFAQILKKRFEIIRKHSFEFILGTSRVLYEELLHLYPEKQVIYLPNGVDISHYNITKQTVDKFIVPERLAKAIQNDKKIIGYFGAIAPWICDELIIELSKSRPEYFILMIGPYYGDRKIFEERDNIYLPGKIDYQDLPFYAKYFDVSIIPFRLGDIAKATSPLKLFEYFAIGKPVVVTSDLIECTKFEGVFIASTPQEFLNKVDEATEHSYNNALQQKYQQYAEENSWNRRAKELDRLINNRSKE